jgi:hypothetical protein
MGKVNRPSVHARDEQFVAGIGKRLQNVQSLAIAGKTYTPADLVKLFQQQIAAADGIDAARAKLRDATQAFRDLSQELTPIVIGFRHFVRNQFGDVAEVLSDFGIPAAKPRAVPTLEQKAAAAAKRKATREARHTMGPKKKKISDFRTALPVTSLGRVELNAMA